MSTLGSTRGSTRGSVKLTGYESADSLSRRPYSHNGSMQRIRDHMERKIDRIEHRHQKVSFVIVLGYLSKATNVFPAKNG